MSLPDELSNIVLDAVRSLSTVNKANFLLETALTMTQNGRYGPEVENYFKVVLETPNMPKESVAKALMARGNARKAAGERMIAEARQDFQAVAQLDPAHPDVQAYIRRERAIHFLDEPAYRRTPAEVWERIAIHIPRHHLRTWLFVSSFYREIAQRIIFHTLDIYFGDDPDNRLWGLALFERAKDDAVFASRVKSLRLHWAYEDGDALELMTHIFRAALPSFKHLQDFEWIGYPELREDVVKVLLASHPNLKSLGSIGWHFDAIGVSRFEHLRKFTLRAEDDDGDADMGEIRALLDRNESTLKHLILGAYLARPHSWDNAFESMTIRNLTHLDLVDTRISQLVFSRIGHAHGLRSLTLHGTFEEPNSAAVIFGGDHILPDGSHTFLPHLEAFRLLLVGHDDVQPLYQSVVKMLLRRKTLRRLDLGSCAWELLLKVLPSLAGLRVLGVRIASLSKSALASLVSAIPHEMTAMHVSTSVSEEAIHEYAGSFLRFHALAFLHLHSTCQRRPRQNLGSDKEYKFQSALWAANAKNVACALPTLDFLGWHGEHYVIVRPEVGEPELKELPARKRLDCAKGVDLGSEDAAWLERKDVPMDYEMPGLE